MKGGIMSETITIGASYGVSNNGTTNVTSQVQAILDSAGAGATIVFPPGRYLLSGVTLYKRTQLTGPGELVAGGTGGAVINVAPTAADTVIEGLRFAGNGSQRFIDTPIPALPQPQVGPARLTIRGNFFGRGAWYQAMRIRYALNPVVEGNRFEWSQTTQAGLESPENANGLVFMSACTGPAVRGNHLTRTADTPAGNRGIVLLICHDAQIVGNLLESLQDSAGAPATTPATGTSIQLWSATGSPVRGGVIAENVIIGGFGSQIYLKNEVLGTIIQGNAIRSFDGNGNSGIMVTDGCDRTIISGNVVEGGVNASDGMVVLPVDGAAPAFCVISGNLVTGCRHGLRVTGEGHRVTDNILRANRYQQYLLETNANAIHAYDNLFEQGGAGLGLPYGGNVSNTNCVIRLVTNAGVESYKVSPITTYP
jgi:hypothetical protein